MTKGDQYFVRTRHYKNDGPPVEPIGFNLTDSAFSYGCYSWEEGDMISLSPGGMPSWGHPIWRIRWIFHHRCWSDRSPKYKPPFDGLYEISGKVDIDTINLTQKGETP